MTGLLVALLALAAPAGGGGTPGSQAPAPREPPPRTSPPRGYELDAAGAIEVAERAAKVRRAERRHGPLDPDPEAKPPRRWEVGFRDEDGREVALVILDDRTSKVLESWDGHQVAWVMARGYEGAFGRSLNSPWIWLPLCAAFLAGLVDWRRPLRMVHLDLLVLLAFGLSHIYFNRGEIGVSVPLVYPPLAYLLGRMLWMGWRGRGPGLRPTVPAVWLAVAALALVGGRVALNVLDSNVIDVGYSGVIGADNIADGEHVYGNFPEDNHAGDTYGPAVYYAYVPFEQAFGWRGVWDSLPAAHGAAIFFDLLAMAGLVMAGRRLRPGRRGTELGVVLGFAWAAYPYTAFALETNANDALVAALVVWAFVALSSPVARGALLAFASATKFAPLALAPLFATYRDGRARLELRTLAPFALAFGVAVAALALQVALGPGLGELYDRTIGFQAGRDSPFSVWGQVDGIEWAQTALKAGVVTLALAVALVPRQRPPAALAALAAAVLIAAQLTAEHWFYLYLPWFFPLVAIALAGPGLRLRGRRAA